MALILEAEFSENQPLKMEATIANNTLQIKYLLQTIA
jgi:hypothetical protein